MIGTARRTWLCRSGSGVPGAWSFVLNADRKGARAARLPCGLRRARHPNRSAGRFSNQLKPERTAAPGSRIALLSPASVQWMRTGAKGCDSRRSDATKRQWLGGRDTACWFFACFPILRTSRQLFRILTVAVRTVCRPVSPVCRCLPILRARCHSKCHSQRIASYIIKQRPHVGIIRLVDLRAED